MSINVISLNISALAYVKCKRLVTAANFVWTSGHLEV
ncbi:hypothetical protein MTBSS4_140033 [Magnetospirillum sp. SS-4]|nr:hypothetical protein MTBSS4_140033 [Magnetospirillum sp. SS-4]